jgi:integrase
MTRGPRKLKKNVESWTRPELHRFSVEDGTLKGYESQLQSMKQLGLPLSFDGFIAKILRKDGLMCGSLKTTRSALSWYFRCHRLPGFTPDQHDEIRQLLRGRRRAMGEVKRKGAITFDLLEQLIGWMRNEPKCTARDCVEVRIAWGTALRACELKDLRRHQFFQRNGEWMLVTDECHRPDRGDREEALQVTRTIEPRTQEMLSAYLPLLGETDLVCPAYRPRRVNAWIKKAAAALKWDPRLSWKGGHQFRHGNAVETVLRLGRTAGQEMLGQKLSVLPSGAIDTYMVPNHRRGARAAKFAKKTSKTGTIKTA